MSTVWTLAFAFLSAYAVATLFRRSPFGLVIMVWSFSWLLIYGVCLAPEPNKLQLFSGFLK